MIEAIIIDYLREAGLNACAEVPPGGGAPPFVVVDKTGGGAQDTLRLATVAVQSYGNTMLAAATLSEHVIELMDALPEHPQIASCRLNADYNYTDTAKKQYRYQAVFDIVYYD